ncbi:SPOR domain-containing protein [Halochromatium sp.]
MTKDYRRPPSAARRRGTHRGTCAFWFLLGGVLGAFGVGYAWMIHEPAAPGSINEEATTRPPKQPPQERQFDFFSMLPQEEVLVPAEEPAEPIALPPASAPEPAQQAPAAKEATTQPAAKTAAAAPASRSTASASSPSTSSPGGSGNYLLQLGSFRSTADAERLKAQLALKGIQTSIQTVTIDNGQTYHRVRTASLEKSQAQSLSAKLEREGQDSIMVRVR